MSVMTCRGLLRPERELRPGRLPLEPHRLRLEGAQRHDRLEGALHPEGLRLREREPRGHVVSGRDRRGERHGLLDPREDGLSELHGGQLPLVDVVHLRAVHPVRHLERSVHPVVSVVHEFCSPFFFPRLSFRR